MMLKLNAAIFLSCLALSASDVEPSATLFENDSVIVKRALEQPHSKSKFHEHTRNRVMIYMQAGQQRFEYQDGRDASISDWKAGQVDWSPAGGMHTTEVLSDKPFNIIEIELKSKAGGKLPLSELDPVKVDPKLYQVAFENSQVRVIHAKFAGHGVAPLHEHAVNRVTVFLTDQDFRVTDKAGSVTFPKHKAGEAAWGTPIIHTEENLSDKPFEVVAVELKN